jgi:hypothetical protein
MREIVDIPVAEVAPDAASIIETYGTGPGGEPSEKLAEKAAEASALINELTKAVGVLADISVEEFGVVYEGEGMNAPATPLADVFPRADDLALFAVTMGPLVSAEITGLFDAGEFALGYLLDAAASNAADAAAEYVEGHYGRRLAEAGRLGPGAGVLRYSPGYCGWDVSGQKKLFEYLKPEEIGITLRESFLMEPLKSVSGVIVAGPAEIHVFELIYPFCRDCVTKSCLDRLKSVPGEGMPNSE